jgi:hypothetical protein
VAAPFGPAPTFTRSPFPPPVRMRDPFPPQTRLPARMPSEAWRHRDGRRVPNVPLRYPRD